MAVTDKLDQPIRIRKEALGLSLNRDLRRVKTSVTERVRTMVGLELTYMARQWKSPEDPPPLYGALMASSEVDRYVDRLDIGAPR